MGHFPVDFIVAGCVTQWSFLQQVPQTKIDT